MTEIKLPGGSIVCDLPIEDVPELHRLGCEVRTWLGPAPPWVDEEVTIDGRRVFVRYHRDGSVTMIDRYDMTCWKGAW